MYGAPGPSFNEPGQASPDPGSSFAMYGAPGTFENPGQFESPTQPEPNWSTPEDPGSSFAMYGAPGDFGNPGDHVEWGGQQDQGSQGVDGQSDHSFDAMGNPSGDDFGERAILPTKLDFKLDAKVRALYEDAKMSIWSELPADFPEALPGTAVAVVTQSSDREDYILHPPSGEVLSDAGVRAVRDLARRHEGKHDVQIVISDGLDALSLTDPGHLPPYLDTLLPALADAGYDVAPEMIVVTTGRVRAGYQIGEILYGSLPADSTRAILHVIGERPGSGHRAYSVYITAPPARVWAEAGKVDHDLTKVVAGIADTSLDPVIAATQTVDLLRQLAP